MIVLCLIPLLNACATPDPILVRETVKQHVPEALTTPCKKSALEESTYQGAIELAEARGRDVDECNKRLEDIRAWSAPATSPR